MKFKTLLNLKKARFAVLSLVLVSCAYFLAGRATLGEESQTLTLLGKYIVFLALTSILSSLFIQYLEGGSRGIRELLFVGLTPFSLVLGAFFFFNYYPNLALPIKLGAGLFYAALLYTLLLLNNVLLVVKSREDVIPVYRVAINWVQIVLLSVSISLFTGMHRLAVQPVLQTAFVVLVAFNFFGYLFWVFSYEKETRQIKLYESVILAAILAMFTGWASFITLFFSAETFLRGLFVASVFLLGLGYIQLYLKNALSKNNIWNYLAICLVFFIVLVLFKP